MDVQITQVTERDRGIKVVEFEVHQTASSAIGNASALKELAKLVGRWRERRQDPDSSSLRSSLR